MRKASGFRVNRPACEKARTEEIPILKRHPNGKIECVRAGSFREGDQFIFVRETGEYMVLRAEDLPDVRAFYADLHSQPTTPGQSR